jgi:hypothetical protein
MPTEALAPVSTLRSPDGVRDVQGMDAELKRCATHELTEGHPWVS